jgi:hypothetical protein
MRLPSLLVLAVTAASGVQSYASPPVSVRVDAGFEAASLVTQYL